MRSLLRENSRRRAAVRAALFANCADTILCFDRRGCPLIKDGHGDGQNHPVKLHGVGEQSGSGSRGLRKSKETRNPRYVRFGAA